MGRPIHPIIFNGLVDLLMRDFSCNVEQAISLAGRLIESLRTKDLEIVRGNWMDKPPIEPTRYEGRGKKTWESLAKDAEEWLDELPGISRWNPPELQ